MRITNKKDVTSCAISDRRKFLIAAIPAIPGAYARPLTTMEHFPNSAASFLCALATTSLATIIAREPIQVAAAATCPEIPALPEANPAAVAAFCAFLATVALFAWQQGSKKIFGHEVITKEIRRDPRWEDFLKDPTHPDSMHWRGEGNATYAKVIPDSLTITRLKTAII